MLIVERFFSKCMVTRSLSAGETISFFHCNFLNRKLLIETFMQQN